MVDAQDARKIASDRDGLNIPVRGAMAAVISAFGVPIEPRRDFE